MRVTSRDDDLKVMEDPEIFETVDLKMKDPPAHGKQFNQLGQEEPNEDFDVVEPIEHNVEPEPIIVPEPAIETVDEPEPEPVAPQYNGRPIRTKKAPSRLDVDPSKKRY